MPVSDVAAEGEEDDVAGTGEGLHLVLPLGGVGDEVFHGDLSHVPVAPAVGGQLPAVVPQALRHGGGHLPVGFVGGRFAVGGRGAVAQNAVVAGEGQDALGSLVGKAGMLLNEAV